MKLLLLFTCLFSTTALLSAQDTTLSESPQGLGANLNKHFPVHFEVGANMLQLARAINTHNSDSAGLNPWLLDGRLSYRQFGIRGSFGGSYHSSKKFIPGFRDSETHTISSANYRAGINYRASFNRRFSADVGLDWMMSNYADEKVTDSGFDVIQRTNQSTLMGGGLSMGTSWWLSKRLSIKLELSYYYLTGTQKQARRFINFPELDDQIDNLDLTEIRLPVGLFITYQL